MWKCKKWVRCKIYKGHKKSLDLNDKKSDIRNKVKDAGRYAEKYEEVPHLVSWDHNDFFLSNADSPSSGGPKKARSHVRACWESEDYKQVWWTECVENSVRKPWVKQYLYGLKR